MHYITKLVFALAITFSLTTASAAELRIAVNDDCPQTGGPSSGESAMLALAIPLGVAVAQKVAGALIDEATAYLKDDTNITKTGYARVNRLLESPDGKTVGLSRNIGCVYGVVGDFEGNSTANTGDLPTSPPLNTKTRKQLKAMGLKGEPSVYFEGFFQAPKTGGPTGVFYFEPRLVYYREHVKGGGLFGSHKRDIGFTVDFIKPNETSAFVSTTISLEALAPNPEKAIEASFFKSRQTPWLALPSADKDTPFTVKVTFIETGKPDILDKAIGEALADKKADIVKAIGDALMPKASGSTGSSGTK